MMKKSAAKASNDQSNPLDNDCNDDVAFDDADVAAMMGFSGGFGSKKKQRREEKKKEEKSVIGEGRRAEKASDDDARNRSRDAASNSKRRENVVVDEYGKRDDNDDNDNNKKNNTTEEEENDDDDDNESDEYEKLPISDEVELGNPHKKTVTTIAVERTGSRFITGARDGMVKLYDFNGMRKDLHPFREIEPNEGYPVHSLDWSPSGDAFVVATGSNKAKIFDRDGRELGEFESGDMYILDSKNTRGHTHNVTKACWNPIEKSLVITSADDGTVRIWNCLLYTSPSPRDGLLSRMPSSA